MNQPEQSASHKYGAHKTNRDAPVGILPATDMVTSPITPKGSWFFGLGAGLILLIIRLYGGLPEGVMYAILLMNALTPLINRYTVPQPFGEVAA